MARVKAIELVLMQDTLIFSNTEGVCECVQQVSIPLKGVGYERFYPVSRGERRKFRTCNIPIL